MHPLVIWSVGLCLAQGPADAGVEATAPADAAVPSSLGELFGSFSTELRTFFVGAEDPEQFDHFNPSLVAEPGWSVSLGDDTSLRVVGFLRVDRADRDRTHADVRELYLEHFAGQWVFGFGVGKVFWGVVESRHLVDIVNQTDFVENLDGEDKLGQPMVRIGRETSVGTFDLYVLPFLRVRTWPGPGGRLRPPVLVDDDNIDVESPLGRGHIDVAVRWSQTWGDFDWGVSYFYGHSREPELRLESNETGLVLKQRYGLIHQVGSDVQWTVGAWLLKVEAIVRANQGPTFAAVSGGFEYTFYQLFGTTADLGIIAEYHYDGRDNLTFNFLERDAFGGLRLALNDEQSAEILAGAIVDVTTGSTFVNIEASRRLGSSWRLNAEARLFVAIDADEQLAGFQDEDYVQLELQWFF